MHNELQKVSSKAPKDLKWKMGSKDLENVWDLTEYALAVIMKAFPLYLICDKYNKKTI